YGAGAFYPAADPPDLRLAPGHPPFRPQDRLAGAPGSPEGPDGAEVPPAGTHHSGSHPPAGDWGLDGGSGGGPAGHPDAPRAARHLPGRGDCRGHRHHADLRRGAAVLNLIRGSLSMRKFLFACGMISLMLFTLTACGSEDPAEEISRALHIDVSAGE
ncbi:LURP-one-related family protein, partial [Dysosmobacter welbionis]